MKNTLKTCFLAAAVSVAFGANATDKVAPADYEQFQDVLKVSKLQASDPAGKSGNKSEYALNGEFDGLVLDSFYVDKASEALVFKMPGYKNRSEVRIYKNFNVGEADKYYHLGAEIQPINPSASVANTDKAKNDAITYLQVHNAGSVSADFPDGVSGEGYIPHPLVRVVYEAERSGKNDWYWAVIKNNAVNCGSKSGNKGTEACKNAYLKLPIAPIAAEGTDKFDIYVGGNKLIINHNDKTAINHDITYWNEKKSYFKAGVYNQFKNGESEAHFYKLTYSVESQPVIN
jgi:hypothetical protein